MTSGFSFPASSHLHNSTARLMAVLEGSLRRMCRTNIAGLAGLAIFLLQVPPASAADATTQAAAVSERASVLATELAKANILADGSTITCTIKDAEAQLEITSNAPAIATDNDCKINAVLLARKTFSLEPSVARVRAVFSHLIHPHKREIVVKAGDVIAFGEKQTGTEALLSSLEVRTVNPPAPAGSANSVPASASANIAPSYGPNKGATPGDQAGEKSGSHTPPATSKDYTFLDLRLSYPTRHWVAKSPQGSSVKFASLLFGGSEYLTLKFSQAPHTVAGASASEQKKWVEMNDSTLLYNKPLVIGARANIGAVNWMTRYYSSGVDQPAYQYYCRKVFFGWPGRFYELGFHCQYKYYASVNADFERILASVSIPAIDSAGAKPAKSAAHKRAGEKK